MRYDVQTELIENFRTANKLSINKFCKQCKISPVTYKTIMKNAQANVNSFFKISIYMKINFEELKRN